MVAVTPRSRNSCLHLLFPFSQTQGGRHDSAQGARPCVASTVADERRPVAIGRGSTMMRAYAHMPPGRRRPSTVNQGALGEATYIKCTETQSKLVQVYPFHPWLSNTHIAGLAVAEATPTQPSQETGCGSRARGHNSTKPRCFLVTSPGRRLCTQIFNSRACPISDTVGAPYTPHTANPTTCWPQGNSEGSWRARL